jgi:hypothetical protein
MVRRARGLARSAGDDVVELMHDGCPTACVDDAGFAYVGAYSAHVSVGFLRGSDPPVAARSARRRARPQGCVRRATRPACFVLSWQEP